MRDWRFDARISEKRFLLSAAPEKKRKEASSHPSSLATISDDCHLNVRAPIDTRRVGRSLAGVLSRSDREGENREKCQGGCEGGGGWVAPNNSWRQ